MNATAPFIDADGDGLPDIETESDLDRLLASITERIAALMSDPGRRFHDLTEWQAINELIVYAGRWHDADGNRIPVQPDPEPDVLNLSPAAVHPVEGQDFTFYDALDGLFVSHQRSNGCVVLANPYLTGVYWRDNAEEVARELGCSARIIAMAGHYLVANSRWGMLPLTLLPSANSRWTPAEGRYWISDGGTPFNADELRMCIYNYDAQTAMHGAILAGATLAKAPFYQNPGQLWGEEDRDLLPGHAIWTAGQRPEGIVSKLITQYNTTRFMRKAYLAMLYQAHKIDDGDGTPVPGYEEPADRSLAWREANEDSDVTTLPRFTSRGLLR